MILAIARVMLLTLLRDRGSLAMVLALPPLLYLVFAAIFASASGGEPHLRVGLALPHPAPELVAALAASPALTVTAYPSEDALRLAVAEGGLDAGVVARGPLARLDPPPVTILVDPGKRMAGAMLEGRVRRLLAEAAPAALLDRQAAQLAAAIGPLTAAQSARLQGARAGAPGGGPGLTDAQVVGGGGAVDPTVTYYAGAVAVMFLLFSATQGAAGLIDERESGILDRFAAGPGGIDAVVLGKALFLTGQGAVQAALVFAAGAAAHGVPVAAHLPEWAGATLLVAAATAATGLLCAAACETRAQAQTVSTTVVLVSSALGGSMVPRFLMPDWLRDVGTLTPNAWAVDLYQGLLSRELSPLELPGPILALAALALGGLAGAVLLSRRRMTL